MENLAKFWKILELHFLLKTPLALEPADGILGKLGRNQQKVRVLTEVSSLTCQLSQHTQCSWTTVVHS